MVNAIRQRIHCGCLVLVCLSALLVAVPAARADGLLIPLAQAAPPVVQPPSNVTAPPRYYVVEGIVIVVVFAAAVFAVCRSSGRN